MTSDESNLLETSVEVISSGIPRVAGEMFLLIGVRVREGDQASVRRDVRKSVENVGEVARGDVGRLEIGTVDTPAQATSASITRCSYDRASNDHAPVGEVGGLNVSAVSTLAHLLRCRVAHRKLARRVLVVGRALHHLCRARAPQRTKREDHRKECRAGHVADEVSEAGGCCPGLVGPSVSYAQASIGDKPASAPYKHTRYVLEEFAFGRACLRFVCFTVCFSCIVCSRPPRRQPHQMVREAFHQRLPDSSGAARTGIGPCGLAVTRGIRACECTGGRATDGKRATGETSRNGDSRAARACYHYLEAIGVS